MSGLALIAHALGAEVSGCDRAETPYFARAARGGDRADHRPRRSACRRGHRGRGLDGDSGRLPELEAARRGCSIDPELLAQAARLRRVIAVGGTHGKTTTTAMVAHVLRDCGLEPSCLVGAELLDADGERGQRRWGEGEWMVVEADESDRSFLRLDPEVAVVTNVELDHHTTYGSEAEVERRSDVPRARPGRRHGRDLGRCGRRASGRARGDARSASARVRRCSAGALEPVATGSRFELLRDGRPDRDGRSPGAGEHNVLNALAALAACEVAGCRLEQAAAALGGFRPAGRRFELRGEATARSCVRRLCPPRDGGRGDTAGGPDAGAAAAGRRLPAPPLLTHSAHAPELGRALASRTWSWCSTCMRPESAPRASWPG